MNTTFGRAQKTPAAGSILSATLLLVIGLAGSISKAQPEYYGASTVAGHPPAVDAPGGATIVVTHDDCRRLQKYVPARDVAYQPGVTTSGAKVAPADMSPTPAFGNADNLDFSFTLRLKDALPAAASGRSNDIIGEAPIGRIEFHGGVVSFNGVPLAQDQLQAVGAGCAAARDAHDKRKKHK